MYNPSEEEKKILQFWEENNIFEKSLAKNKKGKAFVFYDGPPFATGTPHYGHLLQSAVKDAIPRYKTMQGFYVSRQWGWDCHGLPIENIVEKELGTKTKKEIMRLGVKKFNDLCREKIFTFINEWERVIPRFGRWADMKNPYRTMDFGYMQSEWWAFKELYKKGLIYEDYKSLHICPRCETTLSQGEVADNYREVKDLSVVIEFHLNDESATSLLVWTTTPWTLPGNVALAMGENIKYLRIKEDHGYYILGKDRFETYKQYFHNPIIEEEITGKDLMGLSYKPLFDNYAKDETVKNRENGWKIYAADFVNTDEGTGIVHIAPAFGADDMQLGRDKKLPFVQHVAMDGIFKQELGKLAGTDLKPRAKNNPEEIREADLTITRLLEEKGLLFHHEKYQHSYPHCWRCETALINYSASSWFVAVEKIKPKLLTTAKKIYWSPEHIKEGRFGQWLKGAKDWSISRQRFWANTIPVWRCTECKQEQVFASTDELEKASGKKVTDIHKDVVDEVIFKCNCGGNMQRIPDVLDTWFDSGSVPFSILAYPAENQKEFSKRFPADFIGEAQDQTRAWFYYQHVLAGALFNKPAFKNCVVTGIILAEDGKKMSKKLQNYPNPSDIIEKYGADAMRYYMLSSQVVKAENLSFSEKGVNEVLQKNISRLYNVFSFYKLYENGTKADNNSKNILDAWILARLKELILQSTAGYEQYSIDEAVRPVADFIDDLSVWYVRRSRERFKEEGDDKKKALATLRYVLEQLSLVVAPSMPFFAEYLFSQVKDAAAEESVHLSAWPKVNKLKNSEKEILENMKLAREISSLALAQRMEKAIKVKQPLSKLKVKSQKLKVLNREFLDLVKDEINIKEVVFDSTIATEIEIDTTITEELKQEGIQREIVRIYNEERKIGNYVPNMQVGQMLASKSVVHIIAGAKMQKLMKLSSIKEISSQEEIPENYIVKELMIDGEKTWISIPKLP